MSMDYLVLSKKHLTLQINGYFMEIIIILLLLVEGYLISCEGACTNFHLNKWNIKKGQLLTP